MTKDQKNEQIQILADKYHEFSAFISSKAIDLGVDENMARLAHENFYNGLMWMREAIFGILEEAA